MVGVDAPGRLDLGTAIPAEVRAHAPDVVELVERDAWLQKRLVSRSIARLAPPGTPAADGWRVLRGQLHLERDIDRNRRAWNGLDAASNAQLDRNRIGIPVTLGSIVVLPEQPLDPDPWAVIGIDDQTVHLARRDGGGSVERTARSWSDLLRANPRLAFGHWLAPPGAPAGAPPMSLRTQLIPTSGPIDAFQAAQELLAPGASAHEVVLAMTHPDGRHVLQRGGGEELVTSLGLTKLVPFPATPTSGFDASALVDLSMPTEPGRYVFVEEPTSIVGRPFLVATEDVHPSHRTARDLAELDATAGWFERLGLPTWRHADSYLQLTSGNVDRIGTAGVRTDPHSVEVITGPRDRATVETLARAEIPADAEQMLRWDDIGRRHWRAILTHEVGHVASTHLWGADVATRLREASRDADVATFARLFEHEVVEEAFSDLFAVAREERTDLGIRDAAVLPEDVRSLDDLRAAIARAGFDASAHHGVQLLTKPALHLRETHGWDAIADVTAGATRSLGTALGRGELDSIDVPAAARALRDAAAMRFGEDDDAVRAMTSAWRSLRVLA